MNENRDEIYDLTIDAYTPTTIPMARLAEYLQNLADLMGVKESVHFQGLKPGSTRVLCGVQREAAFTVAKRVAEASTADRSSETGRAYLRINQMLRENSAAAELSRNGASVLIFPGAKALLAPVIGPFTQDLVREGTLVRIGGKDKTAHAIIEDYDGAIWSFSVTRDLARQMSAYLYGTPVRLIGYGRCSRDENGEWQCTALRATRFEPLDASSLAEIVEKIRALPPDTWHSDANSVALMSELRGAEEEGD